MKFRFTSLFSIFIVACWFSPIAWGELPHTRLNAISPVGGQAGTSLVLSLVAGEDLEEVTQLRFSHPGLRASLLPATENQSAAAKPVPLFSVSIDPDVPPGIYDVVCEGRWGVSSPRRFVVGQRPVCLEHEGVKSSSSAQPIQIGEMINGCLTVPQEVDWYRIRASAGDLVIFDCRAAEIDSRLHPIMTVMAKDGRQILASSRGQHRGDPVLTFLAPQTGEYLIKVHDVTYRGGADYPYLLDVHTESHLLFAEPSVVSINGSTPVTLFGYHLPGAKKSGRFVKGIELDALDVEVAPTDDWESRLAEQYVPPAAASLDAFDYRFIHGERSSFPISFGITPLPVRLQADLTSDLSSEKITLPVTIQGRFDLKTRQHRFRFQGDKGESLTFDVIADRRGSLLDPMLVLERVQFKDDGQEELVAVASADDSEPNLLPQGFESQSTDPTLTVVLPESAIYQLTLRNRFGGTADSHQQTYQLSMGESLPDFQVVAIAGSPGAMPLPVSGIRKGDRVQMTLYAFRQRGFTGAIRVRPAQLPPGMMCETALIPASTRVGSLMVSTSADVDSGWHDLQLIAEEVLPEETQDSSPVQHLIRMATVVRPRDHITPTICRLTSFQGIGVLPESAPARLDTPVTQFEVGPGGQLTIPITIERTAVAKEAIQLSIPNLPKQLTIDAETATIPAGAVAHQLRLNASDELPVGSHFLWIKGETKVEYRRNPEAVDRLKLELAKADELLQATQNAAESTKQSRLAALRQMESASVKLQETQATLGVAQQQVESTRSALEKTLLAEHEAMDLLATAEKALASDNLRLAQAQTLLRQQDEAVSAEEVNVRQANQRVTDAMGVVSRLKNSPEESAAENKGDAKPQQADDKSNLMMAEQQLMEAEAEQATATRQRDSAVQQRDAQKKLNEMIAVTHATSTRRYNELFQKHEQARQVTVTQKQQLAQFEAAHRAALQQVNMAQKAVATAGESLKAAEAVEKEALAAVAAQETRRTEIEKQIVAVEQKTAPQTLNLALLSPSITVDAVSVPFKLLQPALPQGGIAAGGTLGIPVQVQRRDGFAGLISIQLFEADDSASIKAEPVVLKESESSGVLQVLVPADFAPAQAKAFRLKATAMHDNQTRVIERTIHFAVLPPVVSQNP